MDVSTNLTRLVSIFLLFIFSSVQGADVCVKRTACSCVFPNGTGIDLSPSAKNSVYESMNTYEEKPLPVGHEVVLSTYFYHPCFDVLMKINGTVNSTCGVALAVCLSLYPLLSNNNRNWILCASSLTATPRTYVLGETDLTSHTRTYNESEPTTLHKYGEAYELLGTSNVTTNTPGVEFAADGSYIKYLNVPSASFVNLICAETDDEFYVKDLSDPNQLQLDFFSRNACLRQIESTRSVGSTLLIIFFSFVIFYLVLGVCTKKFLMGATGIEVIPNLMFWTELPNLVKDGWAFARSGFKLPTRGAGPTTSPDPNSYDSI